MKQKGYCISIYVPFVSLRPTNHLHTLSQNVETKRKVCQKTKKPGHESFWYPFWDSFFPLTGKNLTLGSNLGPPKPSGPTGLEGTRRLLPKLITGHMHK